MPDFGDQTISQGLANQLANLSRVAADSSADPTQQNEVRRIAALTLVEIDAAMGELNVSSTHFARAVKDLIMSGEWAKLPSPKQMIDRTSQLMSVNDAISDVQKTIIADISMIMAILLEIQRKAAMAKGQERLQERSATLISAQAEFSAKESAAELQKFSDMLQAGMQIATGVLSMCSSSFSIHKMKGSMEKTKKAWDMTKDLEKSHIDLVNVKKIDANLSKATGAEQKIATELRSKEALNGPLNDIDKARLADAEGHLRDANSLSKTKMALEDELNLKHSKIDHKNQRARETTEYVRAWQDMSQAVGGVLNKTVDMGAAQMKFMVSMKQVEADKEALAKNLAQSGEQAALDAYQQLRDSLKSALQMIQAIEQAMSSSLAALSKSI